jgi:hypothetical protein
MARGKAFRFVFGQRGFIAAHLHDLTWLDLLGFIEKNTRFLQCTVFKGSFLFPKEGHGGCLSVGRRIQRAPPPLELSGAWAVT